MIIDISNRADNNNISEFTESLGSMYSNIVNLKEVWLSSKVDIIKYIRDLHKATVNPVFPQYRQYEEQSSKLYTAKGTLFIPEQAANAVLSMLATDPTEPSYTIRTYSGDLHQAHLHRQNQDSRPRVPVPDMQASVQVVLFMQRVRQMRIQQSAHLRWRHRRRIYLRA